MTYNAINNQQEIKSHLYTLGKKKIHKPNPQNKLNWNSISKNAVVLLINKVVYSFKGIFSVGWLGWDHCDYRQIKWMLNP